MTRGSLGKVPINYDDSEVKSEFKEMSSNTLSLNNINSVLIKNEIMQQDTISEFKKIQGMLIQSEKINSLGQVVAGIAHEINNPVAYVMANVEIMVHYFASIKGFFEDCEQEKIENLQIIKEKYDIDYILQDFTALQKSTLEGGERIKKIVSELINYARIDDSEKSIVNIEECIMSSLSIVKPEIKINAIHLHLNFSKTSPIECYPAHLKQVFLNIIINAVQAAGEKGDVEINLYEKENFIIVEIGDNGPGITAENKERIFEPFFTTKPQGKGVGLGLSLSYKIIKKLHNGEICFDSTAGKGTKFTISISKGENDDHKR